MKQKFNVDESLVKVELINAVHCTLIETKVTINNTGQQKNSHE